MAYNLRLCDWEQDYLIPPTLSQGRCCLWMGGLRFIEVRGREALEYEWRAPVAQKEEE